DLVSLVSAHVAHGSKGYIQWPGADSIAVQTGYYEPYAPLFQWFADVPAARAVPGLSSFGVLAEPSITSSGLYAGPPTSDPDNPNWFPVAYPIQQISLKDHTTRLYLDHLKAKLASSGVGYVYWDTGRGPRVEQHEASEYLGLLSGWRSAG